MPRGVKPRWQDESDAVEALRAAGVCVRSVVTKGAGWIRVRIVGGFDHRHVQRLARAFGCPMSGVSYYGYMTGSGAEYGTEVVMQRQQETAP